MNSCRLARTLMLIALFAVAGLLVAGCGGAPKPTASNGGSGGGPSFKRFVSQAYKHSACMRNHGVTSFPDPTVVSNSHEQIVGIHINPAIANSPAFKSAQKACAYLMPAPTGNETNGPSTAQEKAHTEGLLAFAACMRRHGFPRFPDPTAQGQLTPEMLSRAGINLNEPAVRPAAYACTSVSHGVITKADVNRAIQNPEASGSQAQAAG